MRLCAVQARPIKGDIERNIANHKRLLDLANDERANVVIFPELSITGYEPGVAKELATTQDDHRFDDFQRIADRNKMTIGFGMPTIQGRGIAISMILFAPSGPRRTYSKKYIHADEEPFFVHGNSSVDWIDAPAKIAPAICYELSIPAHAADAHARGAKTYFTSVAKTASGVENAFKILSQTARNYSMHVLMANCVGPNDNFEGAGRSAVWNSRGELLAHLNSTEEGLVLFDSDMQAAKTISA